MNSEIDFDDASQGIFYEGSSDNITGYCQPELILETFENIYSKRLYRFKDKDDDMYFYRFAYINIEGIICPECGEEQVIDNISQNQTHEDNCSFLFDQNDLLVQILELNKDNENWYWCDSPYIDLDLAKIELFENSKIKNLPKFKELKKYLSREEDKNRKKINPDYMSERDYQAQAKKELRFLKAEKKRFGGLQ